MRLIRGAVFVLGFGKIIYIYQKSFLKGTGKKILGSLLKEFSFLPDGHEARLIKILFSVYWFRVLVDVKTPSGPILLTWDYFLSTVVPGIKAPTLL